MGTHFHSRFTLAYPVFIWCIAFLAASGVSVRADVEFSTFGTNDSFETYGGSAIFASETDAEKLSASFDGVISSIQVATFFDAGNGTIPFDGNYVLSLAFNNPTTNLPTAVGRVTLGSLTAGAVAIQTLTPSVPYTLVAGTTYWLEMAPGDGNTNVGWNEATNSGATTGAYSTDGGATFQHPAYSAALAFQVNAQPLTASTVPDTGSTLLLLGLGAAALLAAHRQMAA